MSHRNKRWTTSQYLALIKDFMPNVGRCVLQNYQRLNEALCEAQAALAAAKVQP